MKKIVLVMACSLVAFPLWADDSERVQRSYQRANGRLRASQLESALILRGRAQEQRIKDNHKALDIPQMKEWKRLAKAEYDALMAWQRSGKDADRDRLLKAMTSKLELVGVSK